MNLNSVQCDLKQFRQMVQLVDPHLWSHHGCAVAGDVLLAAFVEVALSVALHAGLAGAAGAGAVLRRRRPPGSAGLRTRAGDARRRALVLVGRGFGIADGGLRSDPLYAAGCSRDREGVT